MCCRALGCPMVQVAVSFAAGCQRVPQIRRSPGLASSPGRGLPLAQMAPSLCSSTILLHGSPLLGAEHRTCPANFSRRDWSWAQRRGSVSGAAELPALKSRCERWEPSSSSWWSEFNFRGEGESAKQTECCSGGFSLPPLGPLPTVFIDFNHWRLASSQKKHCVMCSFLAFIKETQCSAVTLPSAPGNLPTPCGTSFIGGDGARGLLGFFWLCFFASPPPPALISKQLLLCLYLPWAHSHMEPGGAVSSRGGRWCDSSCDSLVCLWSSLRALLVMGGCGWAAGMWVQTLPEGSFSFSPLSHVSLLLIGECGLIKGSYP